MFMIDYACILVKMNKYYNWQENMFSASTYW